jgi:TPR repeat protein
MGALHLKRFLLAMFCICLMVIAGRFALLSSYGYALDAHSRGDFARAVPIVYGNALFDDPGACGLLGTMYLLGQGVQRNGTSAEYWLLKAASNGSVVSQSVLGTMYATGRGVSQDIGKAQFWFFRAASGGDRDAALALRRLHKVITI